MRPPTGPYPGGMTHPETPDPPAGPHQDAAEATEDEALALARSMFEACRTGSEEGVLPYLDAGAPAGMRDAEGNSLLMLAAYHGRADLVRALAARGADVDRMNDRGQSPLAGAAFKGFEDVAAALLAAGADPDRGTPSARETAAYFGREEIARLIARERPEAGAAS